RRTSFRSDRVEHVLRDGAERGVGERQYRLHRPAQALDSIPQYVREQRSHCPGEHPERGDRRRRVGTSRQRDQPLGRFLDQNGHEQRPGGRRRIPAELAQVAVRLQTEDVVPPPDLVARERPRGGRLVRAWQRGVENERTGQILAVDTYVGVVPDGERLE